MADEAKIPPYVIFSDKTLIEMAAYYPQSIGERTRLVAEAFNAGESVQSLMEVYGVKAGTILDHLMRYLNAGNRLRNGQRLT
jgi:hypothetical protein